jgi:protein O-GlcNAc transferase
VPQPTPEILAQAVARQNGGDLAGAQALYWQILLDDPAQFDALHLLGVSKCQQGQPVEGAWFIACALRQRPDEPTAHFNLGMALIDLHRPAEAIASFDRAVRLRPEYALAWCSRGDALQSERRHAEAIVSYRRALAIRPELAGAVCNLGVALVATGQTELGLATFRQALAAGADRATVLLQIGRAERDLGDTAAARETLTAACLASPDAAQPRWFAAVAALPDIASNCKEIAASRVAFANNLDALDAWYAADRDGRRDRLEHEWPFYLAYQARNNRTPMAQFGRLRAKLLEEWRVRQTFPPVAANRQGPIRVGVVSGQFYNHSVWQAIARGWFAHLDPARVALHAFQVEHRSDAETDFARRHAASFTSGARPAAEWVRAILAVRPEVLIYPALGLDAMSANLAALRLAPVQLASWGHPETSGLPTIDGFLSAEAFEPPAAEAGYTESLIRLPRLGVCYAPPAIPASPPDLAALCIDPARPILLCPGTPFKYAPADDVVWTAIARAVPLGQLVFFHAKSNAPMSRRLQRRIAARFAAEGMDAAAHVHFIPFQGSAAFHGLLRRADLCLDSIGFSGFNTAMQALAQGTPVVAYEAGFMRGRLASGILRTMGIDELVATDHAEFVAIATRLATDPAWRRALRERIAARLPAVCEDREAVAALQDVIEGWAQPARDAAA